MVYRYVLKDLETGERYPQILDKFLGWQIGKRVSYKDAMGNIIHAEIALYEDKAFNKTPEEAKAYAEEKAKRKEVA